MRLKKSMPAIFMLLFATAFGFALAGCSSESGAEKESAGQANIEEMPAVELPSLQEKLDARKADFTRTAPKEIVQLYEGGVAQVAESGVLETARKEGEMAPDFALPGATGDTVRLSALLQQGPVVLAWYRGGWCPYCNLELAALQEALPEINKAGGQLVAISPEIPDSSLSTKEKGELGFHVLSDVGNSVAREYGIVYTLPEDVKQSFLGRLDLPAYNADDSWELPLAVTYVIGTDGTIRYAFVDPDYRRRAEPAEIVRILQQISGV
jgi:peroxiredoxin